MTISAPHTTDLAASVLRYLWSENDVLPSPDTVWEDKALHAGLLKFLTQCGSDSKEDCIYAAYMMFLMLQETSETVSLIFIPSYEADLHLFSLTSSKVFMMLNSNTSTSLKSG
jgi:hypothetical protein